MKTGEVIVIARSSDFCSNSTFTADLSSCLKYALTYNIWKYYGSDVKSAAEECKDDATPSPSSASGAAAATATMSVDKTSSTFVSNKTSTTMTPSSTSTTPAVTTGAASVIPHDLYFSALMATVLFGWSYMRV
ncbi:hypothetical protein N7492_008050 [Penicillium capsulatum]|uniref:Uncharacterized protein n=1 Tax=Penicillium capsulatum TaxID=69766 RepID=A0A9W9LGQ0_9EURO|nr:hypothetical protein N7492_008050 [Penicillium capsulatum]KAJ6105459.1 hypothetical protein N7512_008976 [Penicillium capsulatum]